MALNLAAQRRQLQGLRELLEKRESEWAGELVQSELKFRTIVENAFDWERWDSPDGGIVYSSPSCKRITGYPPDAFETEPGLLDRIIHPGDFPRWKSHYSTVHVVPGVAEAAPGPSVESNIRIIRADGELRWVEHTCHPIFDAQGQFKGRRVKIRDITDQKRSEEEHARVATLGRFNRIQQAIIECNRVILRAGTEQELLQEFCRISMKVEGVQQAWIGLAESGGNPGVRPVAHLGFEPAALDRFLAGGSHDDFGQVQAGAAIRTGQVCIQIRPPFLWDSSTPAQGTSFQPTQSFIALPLLSDRGPFGALVLNSSNPEIFGEEQVQLLLELANNLSIGILDLRMRTERDLAIGTTERLAEQLRSLAQELAQTEQRERKHLAQFLHDNLQQLLVGATFRIETLHGQFHSKADLKALKGLADTLQEAIRVSRVLTVELYPPVVQEKGLKACLEWLGHHFRIHHGLTVALDLEGEVEPDSEPVRMFIFEAVRELLLNVVKHAGVDQALLRCRVLEKQMIEIKVEDQGVGFDRTVVETHADPAQGLGLFSLRQRVLFLKGSLSVVTQPGHGSRFTLVVPLLGWREDRKVSVGEYVLNMFNGGLQGAHQDPDS